MSTGEATQTLLSARIAAAYRRFDAKAAFRDDTARLTYGEAFDRVRRLASVLRELGAARRDRVALLAPNQVDWILADHAIVLSGMTRVGILPRLHAREVAQIAGDCEPSVLIADPDWLAAQDPFEVVPRGCTVVSFGSPRGLPEGVSALDPLIEAGAALEPPVPIASDPAWLMYTSGSTGEPKGVIATQASLGASLRNTVEALGSVGPGDCLLHTAPVSHFSGQVGLGAMLLGAENEFVSRFDVKSVISRIATGEISVLPLVPTQINLLVSEIERRGGRPNLGALRLVIYAGSAISPDLARRARAVFGDVLLQFYGASESPLPMTALTPGDHASAIAAGGDGRLASAGQPTPRVSIEIVDEQRSKLAAGEVGEVRVAGDHLSAGYWRKAEASAEAFADGWLYTGDVGFLDEDGYLFIVDRKKDMIVSGGFNIYSREVEAAISALAAVKDVAVVGAPDDQWGEIVVAYVELEPGSTLSGEAIRAHCRRAIADYKVPKRVEFLEDLPRGGAGKVRKAELRNELWTGRPRRV